MCPKCENAVGKFASERDDAANDTWTSITPPLRWFAENKHIQNVHTGVVAVASRVTYKLLPPNTEPPEKTLHSRKVAGRERGCSTQNSNIL